MITREDVYRPPTGVLEMMPGDMYQELLPHIGRDGVGNLMLVSKRVYNACLDAQLAWKTFLPEKYQEIQDPCTVVLKAWKKWHYIERSAARIKGDCPPEQCILSYDTCLDWTQTPPIEEVLYRLGWNQDPLLRVVLNRIILLSPWKARDSKNALTLSEIEGWVAIEMCLTRAIERSEAESVHNQGNTEHMNLPLEFIGDMTLLAKEYLSPKFFRSLSRRCDLISSFFMLFSKQRPLLDDTKWRDLARFALENQYKLSLWRRMKSELELLKTWFGSDLGDLSIEYRIFGGEGLMAVCKTTGLLDMRKWKQFLFQEFKSRQVPVGDITEITSSYLRNLVRVGKYVFHDPEQLIRFILSIEQKRNKKILLREGVDMSRVDEFLLDFEGRLQAMIETALADDDAPFCSTSEYEEDHDFVYGRLGPFLIDRPITRM